MSGIASRVPPYSAAIASLVMIASVVVSPLI